MVLWFWKLGLFCIKGGRMVDNLGKKGGAGDGGC